MTASHPPTVLNDDDARPVWLGERMRDVTHAIHRTAHEAALDDQDTL